MKKQDKKEVFLQHIKSLSILCVQDNKTNQILYDSILENLVDNVIYVDNSESGYQKYTNNNIDIIITDYDTDNGLDMIKLIRNSDKEVPIILVSEIEDINIINKALQLGVNNFVKKPISKIKIIEAIESASKLLIADIFLEDERFTQLNELKDKDKYNSYQEDLGFSKELNILKNDFYYQMMDSDGVLLLDFMYQPLDVMSGDAYTARRIDKHNTFYLMIDGMGKGLSASLTAMIMASFVNHIFNKMITLDSFDLAILIHETMEYIKPILLDEEALAIDYIVIDNLDNMIYYAKFAMPVLLMENKNKEIIRLKSNNSPLSKWQPTFNIDSYDITHVTKFLIYSDGIVENTTIYEDKTYADFIEDDLLNSFTREDLKNSFYEKIDEQDDDIALIYIHKLSSIAKELSSNTFKSTLDAVEEANKWYKNIWNDITDNTEYLNQSNIVFTELFMNAYEYGSLGITFGLKYELLENDTYTDTLLEKEKNCSREIHVKVDEIIHGSQKYIITTISDEGNGFDTHILSEIFRNSQMFTEKGVVIARKNSFGIYYNNNGTTVLFLNKA